jgi:hypothetical protein
MRGGGLTRARVEDRAGDVLILRGGAVFEMIADLLRLQPWQVDRVLAAWLDERVIDAQAVPQTVRGVRLLKVLWR